MSVSPAARKSKLLSAALNVKPIEPVLEAMPALSVVTDVNRALASTAASPLGSVAPPDQVIECTLVLTVWVSKKLTSVKLSVPLAVSAVVESVTPAISVIACGPEVSAASTGAAFGLIVIVISWLALAPKLSVSLIVSVSLPL